MDLSQHLVAKHDNLISPVTSADPPPQPASHPSATKQPTPHPHPTQTFTRTIKSEVSATHPANPPPGASSTTNRPKETVSKKRPNAAIQKPDAAVSPPRKQPRTNTPSKPLHKSATTPSPATSTAKSNRTSPPTKSPANNSASPTDTTSGKKRRSSRASNDVALSATKPPITPKKKDGTKGRPVASWLLGEELRLPKQAAVTAAPLDFTWFGGLQANTHQGYYRLVDR